jgi:tRNA dimethylallyltransferase
MWNITAFLANTGSGHFSSWLPCSLRTHPALESPRDLPPSQQVRFWTRLAAAARVRPGEHRRAHHRPHVADHYVGALLERDALEPALSSVPDPLLLAILGPTASGKTALSLALAERFAGEIVNCDTVAMVREFEVGTAKPTPAERARAPHHLFDVVAPTAYITAGEYARTARAVLNEIKMRGHVPIVVGGTGLYLRALIDGLFPGPQRSEELRVRLRERAEQKGSAYLHRILQHLDPVSAGKIHANDASKVIRAIEVCLASRQRMSAMWTHGRNPLTGFRIVRLGLDPDRKALYARINERARRMFEAGLVEEARSLRERYGDSARALASLGYKQALQLLKGELSREQAIAAAQQAHRNYAKRQLTWFRREPDVHWLEGFGDDLQIQCQAANFV